MRQDGKRSGKDKGAIVFGDHDSILCCDAASHLPAALSKLR